MSAALPGLALSGYTTLHSLARENSAVSDESRSIRRAVERVVHSAEQVQSVLGRRAALISRIWALVSECAEPDWDGSGAEPLTGLAAAAAADFVRVLPEDLPLPEAAPEPDGGISLDWIQSRHRLFSISVGTRGRLACAWLDGSDRGHAVVSFDGERVPRWVHDMISEIATRELASVGAA